MQIKPPPPLLLHVDFARKWRGRRGSPPLAVCSAQPDTGGAGPDGRMAVLGGRRRSMHLHQNIIHRSAKKNYG